MELMPLEPQMLSRPHWPSAAAALMGLCPPQQDESMRSPTWTAQLFSVGSASGQEWDDRGWTLGEPQDSPALNSGVATGLPGTLSHQKAPGLPSSSRETS